MADLPVPAVFLGLAALTLAGFWAGRLFHRTRIPDALPLLLLGLVVGPLNRWAAERGWGWPALAEVLSPGNLLAAAPVIAGFALVVLLFESGMQLDFGAFGRSLGPAVLFTVPVYLVTVILVAGVGTLVLGMPLLVAVVLGVVLVNVDQTVSSGILRNMRLPDGTRAVYFVEMALYDLISIPLIVSLLSFASGTAAGGGLDLFLKGFASLLSVSLALGFAVGIAWIFALRRLKGHPHSYMLTFAVMLGTYGLAELLGGSGALCTLLFGLLLGNRLFILRRLGRVSQSDDEHEKVQAFNDEIAFFIRTVFFLFLGASFQLGLSGQWAAASPLPWLSGLANSAALVMLAVLLMGLAIVGARALATKAVSSGHPERRLLFPVFGRGLDTAVLATVPFVAAATTSGDAYRELFGPWQPIFINVALCIVLLTVIASGLAVYWTERTHPETKESKGRDPPPGRGRAKAETGPEVAVPRPRAPAARRGGT